MDTIMEDLSSVDQLQKIVQNTAGPANSTNTVLIADKTKEEAAVQQDFIAGAQKNQIDSTEK